MLPFGGEEMEVEDAGIVASFFIPKYDDENANMNYEVVQHNGLKALCLVNMDGIKKNDELLTKIKLKDSILKFEGVATAPAPKRHRKA